MSLLIILTSTVKDDSQAKPTDPHHETIVKNRRKFLAKNNLQIENATLVRLEYSGDDFCRYQEVDEENKGDGMQRPGKIVADALVTRNFNQALFLPLADCVGAVIYDEEKSILMLSHLGRQSLEQNGGFKSIKFLIEKYDCRPEKLKVWLSPAAGKENYPLFKFDNQSLHEVATNQLLAAGIVKENLEISPIDTTKDENYFSHSEYLKNNRPEDGRFAVVAMMK